MLDFWELLGRVVTEDGFRTNMLAFNNSDPDLDDCECRGTFGLNDFNGLRGLVASAHSDMPVSLMALGEWMAIKTIFKNGFSAKLGDVVTAINTVLGAPPSSTDHKFYQVLGLSMIDEAFRTTFDNTNYGYHLSDSDMMTIATLNGNTGFTQASQAFHDFVWHPDCFAWMFEQGGSQQHAHPLEPHVQPAVNGTSAAKNDKVLV